MERVQREISALKLYESDNQLIIGLDFGSTFSGIAYAFTNTSQPDVVSILDWPGLEGYKQPKVPTVISYDTDDKAAFTWGAEKHKKPLEGVKLLLDPTQETPLYIPETKTAAELKKLGKPAVNVATDYISAIYEHALAKIAAKVPADYLQMCQKKFVVTVPAVWSDKAKSATLAAAKSVGIYPIHLIKEPEAAALYTMHVLQDKSLAVGDAFVLCDAGGGTVDLISYEITSLDPKLELKELVPRKGSMAGSLGLNKRFAKAVEELVGEDAFFELKKTRGFQEAVKQFDKQIKTAFRGGEDEDYYVNFPMAKLEDNEDEGLVSNSWNIDGDDLEGIFKPLMTDILRLVDDQINLVKVKRMAEHHPKANEIKAIFLVGGFGSSEYLKQCIETTHEDIQVIQPHDAWAAIVKGAVLSQMPQTASAVTSTVATKHLGICALLLYDEHRDADQRRVRDEFTGVDRCYKMTWYINRGDDLQREQRIEFPFYRSIAADYSPDQLVFEDDLIECSLDKPVDYPKAGVTKPNCTVTTDLSDIDPEMLTVKKGQDGEEYVDIRYKLIVETKDALMRFSVDFMGQEMGSVEAKYD